MTDKDLAAGARAQAALGVELLAEAEALGMVPTVDEMRALRSDYDDAYGELGALLAPAGWSDEDLAAIIYSPNSFLNGRRMIELLREQPGYLTPALVYAAYRAVPRAARTSR